VERICDRNLFYFDGTFDHVDAPFDRKAEEDQSRDIDAKKQCRI
jgi:hypothetical protein